MAKKKIDKLCASCHRSYSSLCATCHRCENCECVCRTCYMCHRRTPTDHNKWCSRCETCRGCCECRKMPHYTPLRRLGARAGRVDATGVPQKSVINKLDRYLGLELEIGDWKGIGSEKFSKFIYTSTHDASVVPSGQEMVLCPLKGDAFLQAMFELAEKLYVHGSVINNTCALHVHVSGQDLSYWDIRRLLRVYTKIEPEIYDYLILPHRRDVPTVTHFCQMLTRKHEYCAKCERFDNQYPNQRRALPNMKMMLAALDKAKNTSDLKAMIMEMLYNINPMPQRARSSARLVPGRYEELQTRKGGRYEWCRYVGLNLHAWQYRGTIEFRMKEGTSDLIELINWPLWCGWLVQAITKMSEEESRDERLSLRSVTERYMPGYIVNWVNTKLAAGPTERNANAVIPQPDTADQVFIQWRQQQQARVEGIPTGWDAVEVTPRPTRRRRTGTPER